jgi:lysophospholipase L1-like esterase
MRNRLPLILLLSQLVVFTAASADHKKSEHWVGTWGAAENLYAAPRPAAAPAAAAPKKQPSPIGPHGFANQTVRMMARTSIGGHRIRVKFSNAFGNPPVTIDAAHIALRSKDSEIVAGSDHALAFDGKPTCVIGPGVVLFSDPLDFTFAPLADLAVSLYFSGESGLPTTHATGLHNTYIQEGNVTAQAALPDAARTQSYYYLAGIDVLAPANAAAIVTYGDSITDGARSSVESNHSWPALLAARLAAKKETSEIAVINMGIGGNRVLRDVAGVSALGRFDRDVLGQSGVKWLMVLEGINDIGNSATRPDEATTAEALIAGHKQIIEMAHTHGIKVIGCTLTPYEGANYNRPEGEAMRTALNQWIRTSGAYDAVVDFDAATQDKASPKHIRAEFDPGDHLHFNDAGYQAMADAIDLKLFREK